MSVRLFANGIRRDVCIAPELMPLIAVGDLFSDPVAWARVKHDVAGPWWVVRVDRNRNIISIERAPCDGLDDPEGGLDPQDLGLLVCVSEGTR